MLLNIRPALDQRGTEFRFTHDEQIPPQDILGETVTFSNPVRLEGTFMMVEDILQLKGTLTTEVHVQCANCLKKITYPLKVAFSENVHRSTAKGEEDPFSDERTIPFDGHDAELAHLALTLAILALPIRFTCEEGCEGLNQMQVEDAKDDQVDPDHPFAKLKQLFSKDSGGV